MSFSEHRVIVMAGGTGGHVFPALAVAQELRNRGANVSWLGTRKGIESTLVPANGFEIHWIDVAGLRGKGLIKWLLAPFQIARAVLQCMRVVRLIRPNYVLGMGGFVAGPGGLASCLTRSPLIIHEQNAVAGLTNKYLAKMAKRVLTGFPKVIDLPASSEWVGNPVRKALSAKDYSLRDPLNVLVIGGSQGAYSFNRYLPKVFSNLNQEISVWHQCGQSNREQVESLYSQTDLQVKISEFIDDMAQAYQWADVLVCRAGAMTIAECCATAKPALFVPYPHSAGDHQLLNARFMVDAGAGLMVDNADLESGAVTEVLEQMFKNRSAMLRMSAAAAGLHKPDALENVVAICEEYAHA